jgi:hypothetical protein
MSRWLIAFAAALLVPAAAGAQMGAAATEFTVRIENVSTPMTLRLSTGATAPAPTAPTLWVVHTGDNPVFRSGRPDAGLGLESLAEDGDPGRLAAALADADGVRSVGAVNTPVGATAPGPILPGTAYEFKITAQPGERLTLAFMFGQSNDLFYAPNGRGIALFDANGRPRGGDITSELILWDAGTEVNQEPGLGPDQAPRQAAPNTGASERAPARRVADRYSYPRVSDVVRVTITPAGAAAMGMGN